MNASPAESMETRYAEVLHIAVPAHTEYVMTVRLAISGLCATLAMTCEEIEDVKLAVSEACTNAITHAYVGCDLSQARVSIQCFLRGNGDELEIVVGVRGNGFQPASVDTFSLERLETTLKSGRDQLGLGLHVMTSLMDRVEVQSDAQGTAVHLYKRLSCKG